jgi:predicted enzyme related to lactoylglutathione lyase
MQAQIKHIAIISDDYAMLGRFYEAIFHFRHSDNVLPARSVSISDGHVGLNINPRSISRRAGLDHFGFTVDDAQEIFDRIGRKFPQVKPLKRPSTRPFAGFSSGDPAGHLFDVSSRKMENVRDIYLDDERKQDRHVNHLALRTLNHDLIAEFYSEVFELKTLNKKPDDPNHYLFDGRVTLIIMPWRVEDYFGTYFSAQGLDHIGFKVESVEAVKQDIEKVGGHNFRFKPRPFNNDSEGQTRLALFKRQCPFGHHHLADQDGTLIDITENDV